MAEKFEEVVKHVLKEGSKEGGQARGRGRAQAQATNSRTLAETVRVLRTENEDRKTIYLKSLRGLAYDIPPPLRYYKSLK